MAASISIHCPEKGAKAGTDQLPCCRCEIIRWREPPSPNVITMVLPSGLKLGEAQVPSGQVACAEKGAGGLIPAAIAKPAASIGRARFRHEKMRLIIPFLSPRSPYDTESQSSVSELLVGLHLANCSGRRKCNHVDSNVGRKPLYDLRTLAFTYSATGL